MKKSDIMREFLNNKRQKRQPIKEVIQPIKEVRVKPEVVQKEFRVESEVVDYVKKRIVRIEN